jgi:hypothetical protein
MIDDNLPVTRDRFDFLNEREAAFLTSYCSTMGMSPEAVFRHALRLHQVCAKYIGEGCQMMFKTRDGKLVDPFDTGLPKMAPYEQGDSDGKSK